MFGGFGFPEFLVITILIISIIIWIYCIIDLLKSNYSTANKIILALLLIFIPIVGVIVYFALKIAKMSKNE